MQRTTSRSSRHDNGAAEEDLLAEQTALAEEEATQGREVGTTQPLLLLACSVCCAHALLALSSPASADTCVLRHKSFLCWDTQTPKGVASDM